MSDYINLVMCTLQHTEPVVSASPSGSVDRYGQGGYHNLHRDGVLTCSYSDLKYFDSVSLLISYLEFKVNHLLGYSKLHHL